MKGLNYSSAKYYLRQGLQAAASLACNSPFHLQEYSVWPLGDSRKSEHFPNI